MAIKVSESMSDCSPVRAVYEIREDAEFLFINTS